MAAGSKAILLKLREARLQLSTQEMRDEFSHQPTQAKDNYDNFDQTIMNLEVSQIEDHINQAPQPTNHYGAVPQETCYQCFTPLSCN